MKAELRDSLEFLYSDSVVREKPCREMTLDVARGGALSAHILLNNVEAGSEIGFVLRKAGRVVQAASWFRLVDVPVEANTGPYHFIERADQRNEFVTRRAPFRVFDAMEPVNSIVNAEVPVIALRVQVPVSRNEKPGWHTFTVEIMAAGQKVSLTLSVVVHKAIIPEAGAKAFPYTNWFNFDYIATRHGLRPWSASHWRMIERYAKLMVHARQNTFWCPLQHIFSIKDGIPSLNRRRLRRIVDIFTQAGMYFIEGGHLAGGSGGEWQGKAFDVALTKIRATTSEGNAILAAMAGLLMAEIRRNGWQDRWIQHVTDEPGAANAVDYRILVGMVHKYMPGIPLLDATMDTSLVGSVDIWCPQAQEFQGHQAEFETQRKLGDRVWFYTCCAPGGPWLNRLLDMELLRPALMGWGASLFGLDGYLHWGLNHYQPDQNPFHKSVVSDGGANFWPAGDTHIVYPGKDGPWSSLRLEAQREGFEDYELLKRLKANNPNLADKVIHQAIRGFDDYTKDMGTFRAARKALLNAL